MKKEIISSFDYFNRKIIDKELRLEKAEKTNNTLKVLKAKHEQLDRWLNNANDYINYLKFFENITISEAKEFKKRRVEFLNDLITKELANFFPNEGFTANIVFEHKYGSNKAYLVLKDKDGNERRPYMSEGKLLQYLVSYSCVLGVVEGLGVSNVYIDEAFGVASEAKLTDLGELLDKTIEKGIQVILVSQRSTLYSNTPRREFLLSKDESTKSVVLDDVIDY